MLLRIYTDGDNYAWRTLNLRLLGQHYIRVNLDSYRNGHYLQQQHVIYIVPDLSSHTIYVKKVFIEYALSPCPKNNMEKRIRCQVLIDNMQFGFMPGKGTTDAIFIMRQVQEKHQAKKKKLYYAFVDLEKAFDRVPREVVRWSLRKLGVDEWLIRTVMALYAEDCTVVRTDAGLNASFEVKVGLHQVSVLSPLLFSAGMDVVSSEARSGLPSELLYADDLVIMAPTMK